MSERKHKRKFSIGEQVVYRTSPQGLIYEVYSYTRHKDGRVTYNIWNDNNYYSAIDEWQIKRVKRSTIGLSV